MKNCIFCKILNKEIPSVKIYENEFVYAFLDISGDYYGHTLVIPKKHSDNLIKASNKMINEVLKAVKLISKHYVEDCGFSGVNVINNSGESAGQSVNHLHFHVMPRKEGDNEVIYTPIIDHKYDLEEVAKRLRLN